MPDCRHTHARVGVITSFNESLRVGGVKNFDGRVRVTEKWSKLRRGVVCCYKLKMNLIAEGGSLREGHVVAWQMIGRGLRAGIGRTASFLNVQGSFYEVDMLEEINERQKSHISPEFTLDAEINVKNLHNYELSFRRAPRNIDSRCAC